jgi:glycosyltransferase involved in cell wall biosynthesis
VVTWNIRHSLYDIKYEKRSTQWVIRLNNLLSIKPKAIIYNSALSRKQHETFGFYAHRSRVIPNGIDLKKFGISDLIKQNFRSELNIPSSAVIVGHVARFHPMKNHEGFLQAAVEIAQKHLEVHFVLVGRDITLQNKLLTDLIPSEMNNRFHLLGESDDVPELMGATDLFCLSSAWGEGWPNVIGEAMAAGVPCVATNVGDSEEIIGETGIVVPPRDTDALTAGIEKLIMMTSEERRTLGGAARFRIKEKYDLDLIVDQYTNFYSGLLNH